jgi:hypothetical protein
MFAQEAGHNLHDVHSSEQDWSRRRQLAMRLTILATDCLRRVLEFSQSASAPRKIVGTLLGQAH